MTPESRPPAITWLGHSTVVIEAGGARVLTDPLLLRHNGPLRRRGTTPSRSRWADPDVVLLSHLHHDHAELRSLRLVGGAPVVTAPGNAAWLRTKGLVTAPLDAAGGYDVPGTKARVQLVRADHGHRPMPHRPNAVNGHLVITPGLSVWAAGDTSLYDEMADLPQLAGGSVDVALVPIGGWGPRLSGGHMDPVQAAEACARVGARVAIPVHWGTLRAPVVGRFPRGWMDAGGPAFVQALRERAPECRPLVLGLGERAEIPL
ncbi:MBL fold metallo-hydrolase [Kineosporia succinea]|uniref:L-ascorbate metabolism protein UlaG (Beta-lactamase superfamily) n=1 Tax=Kineosporia succinea TaxID=84632 RepID=A0ABT9P847_9ACTN|nr:MBL fold metallo-hydrolase [Kineosporia succinea]MDP9828848.1 L-ascorbate metabolism protein UlaG (beta-lactamase superfamily) [Kineosporia succinea]